MKYVRVLVEEAGGGHFLFLKLAFYYQSVSAS